MNTHTHRASASRHLSWKGWAPAVALLMVLALGSPVAADVPNSAADDVAVLADLPLAIAETEQANIGHYESVLGQNPTNNVTCGPFDVRRAAGTPFVHQSPFILEQVDVAYVESDCVSRQVGFNEYTHHVNITFEYRKGGEWIEVPGSMRPCSKASTARQSAMLCNNQFVYHVYPSPAHPAIDLPHRARFDLVSPDLGFDPAYSDVYYLPISKTCQVAQSICSLNLGS